MKMSPILWKFFLINIFKTVQVYVIAYLLGVLFETFIMNLPYVLLRWHAGGWHAKSTINCSIFGITTFVGIPFILQKMDFSLSFFWMTILSLVILCWSYYTPQRILKKIPWLA